MDLENGFILWHNNIAIGVRQHKKMGLEDKCFFIEYCDLQEAQSMWKKRPVARLDKRTYNGLNKDAKGQILYLLMICSFFSDVRDLPTLNPLGSYESGTDPYDENNQGSSLGNT